MEKTGHLRDAQIDAIKTYLFLKIGCSCKPLWELFAAGAFNSCDLDAAELSSSVRVFLQGNPAAAALYEYACQKNEAGEQVSESLEKAIKESPDTGTAPSPAKRSPCASKFATSAEMNLFGGYNVSPNQGKKGADYADR